MHSTQGLVLHLMGETGWGEYHLTSELGLDTHLCDFKVNSIFWDPLLLEVPRAALGYSVSAAAVQRCSRWNCLRLPRATIQTPAILKNESQYLPVVTQILLSHKKE